MSGVKRITLGQSLAARLRAEIEAGTWSGTLPGYRTLGQRFEVSQPTCMRALEILAKEGVIVRAGERRAWRILARRRPAIQSPRCFNVLWIGETEEDLMEPSTRAVLSAARQQCRDGGGQVFLEIGRYRNSSHAQRIATRLQKRHRPDRVILHNAPKQMVSAMVNTGVPVFMLGGELSAEYTVEGMGHSLYATCRHICTEALRMGRRKILIPVPVSVKGWKAEAVRGLVDAGLASVTSAEDCVPYINELFPGSCHDFWKAQLRKGKPDIIVTLAAHWLMSLYSAAWRIGMRPGEDFQVVTTDSPDLLRWLNPAPTMLQLPVATMQDHLIRWLRRPEPSRGHRFLEMRWPKPQK